MGSHLVLLSDVLASLKMAVMIVKLVKDLQLLTPCPKRSHCLQLVLKWRLLLNPLLVITVPWRASGVSTISRANRSTDISSEFRSLLPDWDVKT